MIGHYLLTLTEEQENRVLTTHMEAGAPERPGYGDYLGPTGARCLVGTVCDAFRRPGHRWADFRDDCDFVSGWQGHDIETQFDLLVIRFGAPRVNAAIRQRILANRARRVLSRTSAAVDVR